MTYPHYISTAIFFANIFRPSTGIFPLIKCKKSCIFIVEYFPSSECSTIFASIWQSSTAFELYTAYTRIIPRKMSKIVWNCQSTLRIVEACKSYFFPSLSLYPYIWKLFKESFDKFIQNPHHYYSTLQLKCQEFFIATFDKFFAW